MSDSPYLSLGHDEAIARFDLLDVASYDVSLDLASDEHTFRSVTTVRFTSRGGPTFVDLKPVHVDRITLDGQPVSVDLLERGRLPLETSAGEHELVVDAVMPFRNDGEGLHRSVDAADGRHYVYGMSFMDAAPTVFACFDQPDLKAPFTFHVRAPEDWTVIGNAPGEQVEPGVWELAQTQPLSTYFVTLVAGPWHVVSDEHDGIPLGLSCRQSLAPALDADADELLTLTRQCFDEFHRLFGIRYPFGNYHQAFVPEFNAGAMENPGCVTFRDPLVYASRVTRGARIVRATTVAHEMAHQWFGNITTPKWWDDLWLNESFAEYMGTRVTADVTEYDDAWAHNSYLRRQWGLLCDSAPSTHPVAGNGAPDALSALQDFDGISYAKGASILKQLNGRMGDEVFFRGVVDHFERHRFGNATMHDLFASWESAGAGDLSDVTGTWLRTAGPDTLSFDRGAGVLRRTPPVDHPADRAHTLRVATSADTGEWDSHEVTVDSATTPVEVPEGAAVLLDPWEETWAVTVPDALTLDRLPVLLPATSDPAVRSGAWNILRSGFESGLVPPEQVIAVAEATLPDEPSDDPLGFTNHASDVTKMLLMEWLVAKVAPLTDDPEGALERLHAACVDRLRTAAEGSTLQLAAFQGAVSSAVDAAVLHDWLAGGAPAGVEVDADLRWRLLCRVAALGATDRAHLDAQLADAPTSKATVDHARAVASLPDPDAKAWAWRRFTGEDDVANYELQSSGQGIWQPGQEDVTAPYAERYFTELPGLPSVHSGWVLASVADWFFPITSVSHATVDRARDLAADTDLDPVLRRKLLEQAAELERRLLVRQRYGAPGGA